MNSKTEKWFKAALVRAFKTFAQTLGGYLAAASLITDIDWEVALSASALAAILSICMSVRGLPEVEK